MTHLLGAESEKERIQVKRSEVCKAMSAYTRIYYFFLKNVVNCIEMLKLMY